MKQITAFNARTQCIELAVEELSKRDSLTITDVREFMDDLVSQKVPTGKKSKYTDPNGEEHEYEIKEPISKFFKYKSDEQEILSRAIEKNIFDKDFSLKLEANVKWSDWLRDLKARSLFVVKEDIPAFIQWAYRLACDVQETCKNGDVNTMHQNLQLQFDSVVKGCGKTTFIHQLVDGAKKLGIPASEEVPLPQGGFNNTINPSTDLIVGFQEHTDQKIDVATMMAIGRRENFTVEKKYCPSKTLKARAITIGSSNGYPYNRDDRTMTVIRCNSLKFEDFPEHFQKMAKDVTSYNTTIYKLDTHFSRFLDFLTKKFSNENKREKDKIFSNLDLENQKIVDVLKKKETARLLLDVLQVIKDTSDEPLICFFDKMSTAKLSKLYKKATGSELTFPQKNAIAELLTLLFSKGLLRKQNYEPSDLYKTFDLTPLVNLTIDDLSEQAEKTAIDEIEDCAKEWDRIIKLAEDFENNPDPDDDTYNKETNEKEEKDMFLKIDNESKLDDSWTVCTRFDSEEKGFDSNGDQVCVNKPLDGKPKNRKNEGVKKENYLFECDDISKQEQVKQIEALPQKVKDSILWVCSTGGKSIHCIIKTNTPDDASSELRKYIHNALNKKYFNENADSSGQNAARLARAPNATRQDDKHPGVHQVCLHFNMNAVPLDVSDIIRDFNNEKLEQRLFRDLEEITGGYKEHKEHKEYKCNTLDELKEWNNKHPSKAKKECIEFLEGTLKDWNRGIACVRSLRNFGFSDYDILMEAPFDDKWVKAAIKGAKH